MQIAVVNRKSFNASTSSSPQAQLASGSALAYNPAVGIGAKAGSAAGSGLANNPTVTGDAVVFTDGRDITASNVGLAGRGLTDADLTTRAGGTLSSGTYTRQHFTSAVVITGAVTLRECKISHNGGDTGAANLRFTGDGTGRALVEWCDITTGSYLGDGSPVGDRAVGILGDMPFTFQYNRVFDMHRGVYFNSHGISADYQRIVQWNMLGNFWHNEGDVDTDHTSCLATGSCGQSWWVEARGNHMQNDAPNGNASGCLQMYPEFTFGCEYGYWLIEKNYLAGTSGSYNTQFGWGPTETRPHDMTVIDNWFGVYPPPIQGQVANSGSPPVLPTGNTLTPNTWNNVQYNNRLHHPGFGNDGSLVGF